MSERVRKRKVVEIPQRVKVIASAYPGLTDANMLNYELNFIKKNSKIKGDIISPVFDGQLTMDIDNLKSSK